MYCVFTISSLSIFKDIDLLEETFQGNIDIVKEAIQHGTNVNARYEVCQYNYNNISVVYK